MKYKVITGTLQARTAVHIGSGRGNDLTDALIRRDAQGRPFITGTAIAGALRTLATRLAPRLGHIPCKALAEADHEKERTKSCKCAVCHLFGDINPSDKEGAESAASRILIFNARLKSNAPRPLIRDGVGIDRVTGAAARAGSVKFDLEVLPAGAEFKVRFELRDTNDTDEQLLAALLGEWRAGRMWLGGRVARGLGAFDLKDVEYKTLDLDEPDNLLKFLKSDKPWDDVAQTQPNWLQSTLTAVHPWPVDGGTPPAVIRGWVAIEGTLQAEGPLLTNDTMVAGKSGFDHAPLLAQMGDWQKPVLTGAGLRGVLRSHAERLARTLTTLDVWKQNPDNAEQRKEDFLIKCPACDPNSHTTERDKYLVLESCDSLLRKKEKEGEKKSASTKPKPEDTPLCLACQLFGSTRRGSRLIVEDAPFDPEAAGGSPKLKMFDFLAIDRFTGGGKEGAKFDALALWKPAFKLRLYLENPQEWELGWLALVLRDLQEGWLSVGFGAAKGFGRVTLQDWTATFGYLDPKDLPNGLTVPQQSETSGIFKTLFKTLGVRGDSDEWKAAASGWVGKFNAKVLNFERTALPSLKVDSYFDGKVDSLYPVRGGIAQ